MHQLRVHTGAERNTPSWAHELNVNGRHEEKIRKLKIIIIHCWRWRIWWICDHESFNAIVWFQHSNAMSNTPNTVQIYVFFSCSVKPFNNRIFRTVQFRCGCVFYSQWLFRWRQKNSLEIIIIIIIIAIYKRTPKEKNVLHGIWSVLRCMHTHTHTCTVDSSFVGFFIGDAIFIFMIRLLSQPDFYRILMNFISIFMRLCRYKLWSLIRICSFLLALLTLGCIFLCRIDNSLSHRFTSFHHKILLFNLRRKNHFADENILKKYKHMCNVDARMPKGQRSEEKKRKRASNHFISYL